MNYGYSGYGAFGDTQADAQAYFERIMHGDTDAVVAELAGKDAVTRQQLCDAMGQIAMNYDVQTAGATGQPAMDGQSNVIAVCARAGATTPPMPAPIPTPTPGPAPAPAPAKAGIPTAGWVILGVLGVGALVWAMRGKSSHAAAA